MLNRRGWDAFRQRKVRNAAALPSLVATQLLAQGLIRRRSRARWLAHQLCSWVHPRRAGHDPAEPRRSCRRTDRGVQGRPIHREHATWWAFNDSVSADGGHELSLPRSPDGLPRCLFPADEFRKPPRPMEPLCGKHRSVSADRRAHGLSLRCQYLPCRQASRSAATPARAVTSMYPGSTSGARPVVSKSCCTAGT